MRPFGIRNSLSRAGCAAVFSLLIIPVARGDVQELPTKKVTSTFNQLYGYRFDIGQESNEFPKIVLDNETTSVQRSVAVNRYVVVLGGIGTEANLVTIFERKTGRELLKLICYNPSLSPDGAYLAFRRFFPRTTDYTIIEDKLAVLTIADLHHNSLIARLPNQRTQLNESVGETVYPPAPSPGSLFFATLLWNEESTAFYFLRQMTGNNEYVVGRCVLQTKRWVVEASRPQTFRGISDPPETIGHLTAFRFDTSGALEVSFAKTIPPDRVFENEAFFDSVHLTALPAETAGSKDVSNAVDVPWTVQQQSLVTPVELLALHVGVELGSIPIRIIISPEGHVSAVQAKLDPAVLQKIRADVMNWQFKPTVLNGVPTAVTTIADVSLVP